MDWSTLVKAMKEFVENEESEFITTMHMRKDDASQPYSAPHVYKMRLPNGDLAEDYAPYIIVQFITGHDKHDGRETISTAQIRCIFCVYSKDEQEGGMKLLGAMDRLRIAILKKRVVGNQFVFDESEGIETLAYPDNTAPYFAGEMVTTWKLPSIEREVIV